MRDDEVKIEPDALRVGAEIISQVMGDATVTGLAEDAAERAFRAMLAVAVCKEPTARAAQMKTELKRIGRRT